MKPFKVALIISLMFCINATTIGNKETVDNYIVKDIGSCKSFKCIPKCCNATEHVNGTTKECIPFTGSLNFDNVTVYTDDIAESGKSIRDLFHLIPGKFTNTTFQLLAYEMTQWGGRNFLTVDGIVYFELPNAYRRWTLLDTEHFCIDYITLNNKDPPVPKFYLVFEAEYVPQSNPFFTTALLISCVFLALTLIVYSLLPSLRNLAGKVLMAYVASLLGAFITLSAIQMKAHEVAVCLGLSLCCYFFFLSSFCWMNVMSFDIWWTFRGYAKARPIHRRGENFKFCMYGIYGWGLPLSMSIAFIILNESDMTDLPWLITPKIPSGGCFLEGGEKLLYLYVPMLILIMCNWIFFLMTSFNIWRLRRGTAVLDSAASGMPSAHQFQRYRFSLYLKLSIIMGVNWVLEVVSSRKPEWEIWYITDAYNLLIGLAVFIIFVCKANIRKQLRRLIKDRKNSTTSKTLSRSQNSSITMDSTLSTDGAKFSLIPQSNHN